jgi:hypothetical protein
MISQYTLASLTALAINWVYWLPKSRIRIFSVIAAKLIEIGSTKKTNPQGWF